LHLAAHAGHGAVVEVLLARGASVDARANSGATPLHAAANGGHAKVVEVLLAHWDEVDAKTESGVTPLQFASRKGHVAVADLLKGMEASRVQASMPSQSTSPN